MVSGGSRGLGAALGLRCGEEGAVVSLCARGRAALEETCADLRERGIDCLAATADVAKEVDVARWTAATLERFGRLDGLVANASLLGPLAPVEEYPPDAWRRVVEVNLTGAFLCARAAIPHLRESGGSIINVSSGVGDHGRPRWGAYSASKNAVEALTEILAGELAEDGVRANSVDPGAMRTEMRAAAYPDEDPAELPTPYEVTDVFVYLLSDRSSGVTGRRFRAREFEAAPRRGRPGCEGAR